jgi:hypothetical protein
LDIRSVSCSLSSDHLFDHHSLRLGDALAAIDQIFRLWLHLFFRTRLDCMLLKVSPLALTRGIISGFLPAGQCHWPVAGYQWCQWCPPFFSSLWHVRGCADGEANDHSWDRLLTSGVMTFRVTLHVWVYTAVWIVSWSWLPSPVLDHRASISHCDRGCYLECFLVVWTC